VWVALGSVLLRIVGFSALSAPVALVLPTAREDEDDDAFSVVKDVEVGLLELLDCGGSS